MFEPASVHVLRTCAQRLCIDCRGNCGSCRSVSARNLTEQQDRLQSSSESTARPPLGVQELSYRPRQVDDQRSARNAWGPGLKGPGAWVWGRACIPTSGFPTEKDRSSAKRKPCAMHKSLEVIISADFCAFVRPYQGMEQVAR